MANYRSNMRHGMNIDFLPLLLDVIEASPVQMEALVSFLPVWNNA